MGPSCQFRLVLMRSCHRPAARSREAEVVLPEPSLGLKQKTGKFYHVSTYIYIYTCIMYYLYIPEAPGKPETSLKGLVSCGCTYDDCWNSCTPHCAWDCIKEGTALLASGRDQEIQVS